MNKQEEIKKQIESIRRNAEKINEHTWKVYKEQILSHVEHAEALVGINDEQTIKKDI